jgi:hypothetical protein
MPGHGKPSGYVSVMCRATDRADGDAWMRESAERSWEYQDLSDWRRADRQPRSSIAYEGEAAGLDLPSAVASRPPVRLPAAPDDSHLLRLAARS